MPENKKMIPTVGESGDSAGVCSLQQWLCFDSPGTGFAILSCWLNWSRKTCKTAWAIAYCITLLWHVPAAQTFKGCKESFALLSKEKTKFLLYLPVHFMQSRMTGSPRLWKSCVICINPFLPDWSVNWIKNFMLHSSYLSTNTKIWNNLNN